MDDFRIPRNRTEALAALSIRRGTDQHRRVSWHHFRTRSHDHHYDINVKEGNSLHIDVYSGLPFLEVRSGHVTVGFHSSWGNSITIHEGASAHVIVPDFDTKVTITNEGGTFSFEAPEKNRVYYPGKYSPLV